MACTDHLVVRAEYHTTEINKTDISNTCSIKIIFRVHFLANYTLFGHLGFGFVKRARFLDERQVALTHVQSNL